VVKRIKELLDNYARTCRRKWMAELYNFAAMPVSNLYAVVEVAAAALLNDHALKAGIEGMMKRMIP